MDPTYYVIFTQMIGFVSTFYFLRSDMQEDDRLLDHYYTIGNVFFLCHLLLLSSFIPALTVGLAIMRNVINNFYPHRIIKLGFLFVFVSIFILTYLMDSNLYNCLPAIVSVLMTFGFLYTKGHVLTLISIICSLLWLMVGFNIGSISIVLLEVVSIGLLIVRTIRIINFK